MIRKTLLTLLGLISVTGGLRAQNMLTQFTFETSVPTTAGPFNAEVNNTATTSTVIGSHAATATYTSPSGNGSTHSYNSNAWAVGDYYQFSINTTGFTGIEITFGVMSSNTGPSSFTLQYSSAGASGPFATFATYAVTNDSWSTSTGKISSEHEYDLSGISALSNNANTVFRLVDNSATAVTGGTVAATGTSRVDDFYVSTGGYVFPASVPEPSAWACVFGSLLLLGATRYKLRGSL